ncbi:MAG TPA: 3-ketoacyl-ACP reductase [Pirellulales bacterium]|jgi:NAD(P)-dependent dehydrogenase (short-subunit alcohol dehydrogenase family)|nr:3-ketoacyl-ACP reductase [Pirellulales bacterium]
MSDSPAALVTGASRGIGRAIAVELAGLGHALVVNYATNAVAARETVEAIAAKGGRAVACQGDVSVATDRERLIERALAEFGRLDVLVNNAGITSPGRIDILEATEENWNKVFDANLKGPFFLSQRAARRMLDLIAGGTMPGAKIINISSISAYAVSADRADYCLSKAAMRMLTMLWAERLAAEKIQVFEVCPGVIATDMTEPVKQKYDALFAAGLAPLGRWGQPEDVARAVAALVQGYFPYSTGDRFNVDGGFHIRRL